MMPTVKYLRITDTSYSPSKSEEEHASWSRLSKGCSFI